MRTVYRFTEIFEFASRLALTSAGDQQPHIDIESHNLEGRRLWVDEMNRLPFHQKHGASIKMLPYSVDVSRTLLVAQPRELALTPMVELFQRFGWDPDATILKEMQSKLRRMEG